MASRRRRKPLGRAAWQPDLELPAGLVDRLYWFRGPCIIGDEGRSAVGALGLDKLKLAPTYALDAVERLGDDLLEIYRLSR